VFVRHTDGKPDNGRRAVKCEPPRHDGRPLYPAGRMRYNLPDFQVGKTRLSIKDRLRAKPPGGRRGPSFNMNRAKSAGHRLYRSFLRNSRAVRGIESGCRATIPYRSSWPGPARPPTPSLPTLSLRQDVDAQHKAGQGAFGGKIRRQVFKRISLRPSPGSSARKRESSSGRRFPFVPSIPASSGVVLVLDGSDTR
jgi:hypothetical protein